MQQLQDQYAQREVKLSELEGQIVTMKKESPRNVPNFTFEPKEGAGKDPKTYPKGDYKDDRVMLAKLDPFSGDPREWRSFINAFLLWASCSSDEQKNNVSIIILALVDLAGLKVNGVASVRRFSPLSCPVSL